MTNKVVNARDIFPHKEDRDTIRKTLGEWKGEIVSIKDSPEEEFWMATGKHHDWWVHIVINKGVLYIDRREINETNSR